jgi:hypothetical protein
VPARLAASDAVFCFQPQIDLQTDRVAGAAVIAMICTMFIVARARALDFASPSMTKHQMIEQVASCMRKRMSVDKAVSYIEAAKACKVQVSKQRDNSASGAIVASHTPAKQ